MDDRIVWAALAALLAVAEFASVDLVAGMLAVGALGGLLAAVAGAPVLVQVAVAVGAATLMLGVVRPVAKRHLTVRGIPNDPAAALEGVTALVVEQVSDDGGRVRVHGELWSARPALPGTVLPAGSSVWIGAVVGATVSVHPLQEVP